MSTISLTSPVSRHLDVTDAAHSIAFYRDVLGFDVSRNASPEHVAELTLGPARITLGRVARPTDGGERNIVFFGVADVDATHDLLRARGAAPSAPENVNWIKLRMFEVRDPDGNTLWFGL